MSCIQTALIPISSEAVFKLYISIAQPLQASWALGYGGEHDFLVLQYTFNSVESTKIKESKRKEIAVIENT